MLFHDINVRAHDFGVWKFWEEASRLYPHFSFDHSNGLGVLVTGTGRETALISMLHDFTSKDGQFLNQDFFSRLGRFVEIELELKIIERKWAESNRLINHFRDAEVEQRKRADSLQEALDQHKAEVLRSKKELEKIDIVISAMKQKLLAQNSLLDEQTIMLSDAQKELVRLKNSSSWRMTKPIRKLTKSTRKRARKLRNVLQRKKTKSCNVVIINKESESSPDVAGQTQAVMSVPEVARPLDIDYSISVPFQFVSVPDHDLPVERVAAVIHIYYLELLVELKSYLKNIPLRTDLYVSTTDDHKAAAIKRVFDDWIHGSVDVRIVPNRGRDVAPKLIAFADVYDHYDYVVFLHGKRSFHADVLSPWRHFLFENLIGSPEVVLSIFKVFQFNPDLGVVAAQHFEPMRHWVNWGGNFQLARSLCEKMGFFINEDDPLDFPVLRRI
ncbi:rhamnan synthesis F family protein [Chlorobium sp.]|uniref:rhamnan synthesis F family protein n=1 Tax=Chlorobium sp. TaxID=1095 RepID=UPI0025C606F7|nr:rhamnan synthesis F family protein [Chlorobium sp.]